MPRLAIAFEFPTLSGGERSMLAVLSRPPADDWDAVALAPPAGLLARELKAAGVSIEPFDLRESGNKPPPEWAAEMLGDAVDRCGSDLVHANSLSMSRVAGRWSATTGRPATGHVRDMMRLSKAAVRDVNSLDAVLCVSAATRDYHLEQGLHADRSHVVHNGVDPPPAGEPVDRSGPPVIATVGQICLRKGHDIAAAALATMGDVDWRWQVVGERFSAKPESVAFDESLEVTLGRLSDRLVRTGYINNIWPTLRRADVLLHPARQEPFGRVLLEASAVGTPVVACDVGGTREMLGDVATLVPVDDVDAMAAAVRSAMASPRPQPMTRFTIDACVSKTWQHWQSVLTQDGSVN